jgi:Zn-dependent M28 family amino/carboxypeptidase
MRRILVLALLLAGCARPAAPDAARIRAHQAFLADDAREGRLAGSPGGHEVALYLSARAGELGLRPAGVKDSWFQPFGDPGKKNVLAWLPGRDAALRGQYVVLAAHYDHVGRGHRGSQGGKVGEVHNGADDNASGASVVLDLARVLASAPPRRSVLVAWFDNEENGLEGSRAWTAAPTRPLADCRAMVNVDMVGRNETERIYCGIQKVDGKARYPAWEGLIRAVEADAKARFDWTEFDPFIKRSDHWPFMEKGVPAMFFTGGLHPDYHREGDDLEKINVEKQLRVAGIVLDLVRRAADGDGRLDQ